MRKSMLGSIVAAASLFFISSVALAQGAGTSKTSSQPFDPHDYNGIWSCMGCTAAQTHSLMEGEPPMLPWALAKYKSEKTDFSNPPIHGPETTDPVLHCEPGSVPRDYEVAEGHPIQFVMTPREVIMLLEVYRNFRLIYMDGRPMPSHPEGTWFGDSIGHWEGNTLAVETANFNDKTWLDKVGHPHTDQMHLFERFTRTDHDHIRMDITIDDPGAYSKPWGGTKIWLLKPDWQINDYLCSPAEQAYLDTKLKPVEATKTTK